MAFMLEYRAPAPNDSLTALWGPFDTRGAGDDFARALGAPGAVWLVISLRDPNAHGFPEMV